MLTYSKYFKSAIKRSFCSSQSRYGATGFQNLELKIIEEPRSPEVDIDSMEMKFGEMFSPHMLEINYSDRFGWEDATIKPLENFSIHPANSTLHYALTCYEGII